MSPESSSRRSHGYRDSRSRRRSPSLTKRRNYSPYSRDSPSPVLPDSYRRSHGNRSRRRSSSLTRKRRNHSSPSRDTSSPQKPDSSVRSNGDRESRSRRKSPAESKNRWGPSPAARANDAPSPVLPESSSRRSYGNHEYQKRRKCSPVAAPLNYSFPAVTPVLTQPPVPPPMPFTMNFGFPPPPPFTFMPPPPLPPNIFFEQGIIPSFSSLFTLPPPPPPPTTMEDEAPGTSGAIPVMVVPSKYMFMPDRPKIKGKIELPKFADYWGHGRIKDYDIMEAVGEGTYGKVFKALHRVTGELVALKKVRLENERDGFPITAVREIKILRQLDHENVIKLIDIAVEGPKHDPEGPSIESFYLVFEYMAHDLHGLIESKMVTFNNEQIGSMIKQLLLALEHCHLKNFLHRDIKCSNILLDNSGQIKLADFGLARLYHKGLERLYTNRVITLWYRPPELLFGLEKYGPEVDMWSIGCILGELFTGKPIFMGQTEQHMLELIAYTCGTPTPENWPGVQALPFYNNIKLRYFPRDIQRHFPHLPSCGISLLDQLLQLDPSKRPTATQALEHPWISRIDTAKVLLPALPDHQDCHEMWSKKMKRKK